MTLRVITGTLTGGYDTFGILQTLLDSGALIQWEWTRGGWVKRNVPTIATPQKGYISIIQPVGSGKTVLAMTYARMAYLKGVNIGGNLSIKWTENNHKRKKEEWRPVINSMEDMEQATFMHLTLDDIRRTILSWNTKDAKMVSEVANASGKKNNWIDITTQRIQNFVPPDLMMLCDEIIVPYIRAKDTTQPSPRNQGKPIQIIAFKFSPGYELISYKVYNYNNPAGEEILNGFDTLQIAQSLSGQQTPEISNKPGQELEREALAWLQKNLTGFKWEHLQKKVFDIVSDIHAIDVISIDDDGSGRTKHKTWSRMLGAARRTGRIPYLMFKIEENWRVIRVKADLPDGQDLNFNDSSIYNRIRSLDSVTGLSTKEPKNA